jgi:hypothetical protein
MINSRIALCADSVVRDAETNAISAFNIIEELSWPGFGVMLPRLVALFVIERVQEDPNEFTADLAITLGGHDLIRREVQISFQEKLRTRAIFTVGPVPIERAGELRISLNVAGAEFAKWAIPIREVPAESMKGLVRLDGGKGD